MTRLAVVGHVEWVEFVCVPRFPARGEVLHATGSFLRAAGGGGVAATVLAEHGADVEFFTAVGRDEDAEAAVGDLEAHGVRVHAARRDGPTRRVVTLLEPGGERTIITIGDRLAPAGGDDLPWDRLAEAAGVYFTAGDAGALRAARRARVLTATPRAGAVLGDAGTTLDALIFSGDDTAETGLATEIEARVPLRIITEGAAGGRYEGAASGRWAPVPVPGAPKDSYGCGDSFAAATTFALGAGQPIDAAVALGAEWGAIALTRVGAP